MTQQTNFSEKELLQDLLATEKQVISSYSVGMTESSCPNLRNTLEQNFKNVEKIQYNIFNAMHQKGWYPIKDAAAPEVQQLKNESNTMVSQLK
ncbi:spore coat protein [Garciella nitratireducens]|uniref:Coat F domain-containing protein n=1 Tax=Garciella nitratireducens DSM 15102 TaxID=1121911 RepID=A0A1T4NVU2_9FIRM|nr:spore coat protein [Garciella nitratireducens]RBP46936.1 coat F domain-containing protein [Garciella nitratireducens]SJZ83384.1 Coat F domain-containing protein [Garciella nitratireducens DSM 15102]